MAKRMLIAKIISIEEKLQALNEPKISMTVFATNGTLYLTTSMRKDLSKIVPGCKKAGSFNGNYFIQCSEEDLPKILGESLGMEVVWTKI